jgi:hypothetical protein
VYVNGICVGLVLHLVADILLDDHNGRSRYNAKSFFCCPVIFVDCPDRYRYRLLADDAPVGILIGMGAAVFWFVVEMALTGPMPLDALTSPRAWQQLTHSYHAVVASSSSSSSSSSAPLPPPTTTTFASDMQHQAYLDRIVLIGFAGARFACWPLPHKSIVVIVSSDVLSHARALQVRCTLATAVGYTSICHSARNDARRPTTTTTTTPILRNVHFDIVVALLVHKSFQFHKIDSPIDKRTTTTKAD